jgi:hypothetical protein
MELSYRLKVSISIFRTIWVLRSPLNGPNVMELHKNHTLFYRQTPVSRSLS